MTVWDTQANRQYILAGNYRMLDDLFKERDRLLEQRNLMTAKAMDFEQVIDVCLPILDELVTPSGMYGMPVTDPDHNWHEDVMQIRSLLAKHNWEWPRREDFVCADCEARLDDSAVHCPDGAVICRQCFDAGGH